MVSKNAGKQKQAVAKMGIGAGGGQVVAPGEQMRQVVTDAGGKAVPQGAVDSRLYGEKVTTLTSRPGWPILARYISKNTSAQFASVLHRHC